MGKLLFWFVVIVTVLLMARLLSHGGSKRNNPTHAGRQPAGNDRRMRSAPDMTQAESMVRCAHCGIYLPRSEAYLSQGNTWCGPEHARLGPPK